MMAGEGRGPWHDDWDHRDAPLRGRPAMPKESATSAVIYGEAGNGKRRVINKLLIDDRHGHLWRVVTYGCASKWLDSSWPGLSRPSRSVWHGRDHGDSGSPGLAAARRPGDDAEGSVSEGHL